MVKREIKITGIINSCLSVISESSNKVKPIQDMSLLDFFLCDRQNEKWKPLISKKQKYAGFAMARKILNILCHTPDQLADCQTSAMLLAPLWGDSRFMIFPSNDLKSMDEL